MGYRYSGGRRVSKTSRSGRTTPYVDTSPIKTIVKKDTIRNLGGLSAIALANVQRVRSREIALGDPTQSDSTKVTSMASNIIQKADPATSSVMPTYAGLAAQIPQSAPTATTASYPKMPWYKKIFGWSSLPTEYPTAPIAPTQPDALHPDPDLLRNEDYSFWQKLSFWNTEKTIADKYAADLKKQRMKAQYKAEKGTIKAEADAANRSWWEIFDKSEGSLKDLRDQLAQAKAAAALQAQIKDLPAEAVQAISGVNRSNLGTYVIWGGLAIAAFMILNKSK